eukprot:14184_1
MDATQVNEDGVEEEKKEIPLKSLKWKDESAEWSKIADIHALLNKLKNYKCKHHVNEDGSITFYPSPFLRPDDLPTDVLSKVPFEKSQQYLNIMKDTQCNPNKLEASFDAKCQVIESPNDLHAFIVAIEIAYFMHYPLKLSPSQIWLLILQSIGFHVDANAEKLREKFVKHEGKKDLIVLRPNFIKGDKNNDWSGVIREFVQQIDKNTVQDTVDLLECDFSTTTITEKIAGKVSIMDVMKHYFNYAVLGGCGFPQITLDGTKKDWVLLRQKLQTLLSGKVDKRFGLQWGRAVLPLIDQFIGAYDGKIDCLFWNSMVRRGALGGSGGIYGMTDLKRRHKVFYSGWFNIFFPLICPQNWRGKDVEMQQNRYCVAYDDDAKYVQCGLDGGVYGPHIEGYPRGVSSAPVKYIDLSSAEPVEYPMKFIAGFLGCDQCEKTLEITPKVGWLIGEQ